MLYDLVLPGPGDPRYRTDDIRAADPLGADALLAAVPAMNADADVAALTVALRALLPDPDVAAQWCVGGALAAMRDLGILLGSLKRHGVQPLAAVPEALPVLELLGRRTDMAPRDTVHHYTTWNPVGPRRRSYTGHPTEAHVQEAGRTAFPRLTAVLDDCARLARLEPYDPGFAPTLDRIGRRLRATADAIALALAPVPPASFAATLRPYLTSIEVAGRELPGPAVAQLSLWPVDLTLWRCDRPDPAHDAFLADALPYAPPAWREFHARHGDGGSALGRLAAAVDRERAAGRSGPVGPPPRLAAAAQALDRALRALRTFRARHLGIARRAYGEAAGGYGAAGGGDAPVAPLRALLGPLRESGGAAHRAGSSAA